MRSISFLLLAAAPVLWGQQLVNGTLLGHEGMSLAKGVISICSLVDGNRQALAETDASGGFSLRVEVQGLYEIQFLGVGHLPVVFPMNFKKGGQSHLRIQLAPRVWSAPPTGRILLEGSMDGAPLPNSAALLKAGDGSYRGTFESKKSLRYRMFPMGHNPRATEFLFDGGMDFYSIQYSKNGHVEVVVQPSDFASAKIPPIVAIQDDENLALMRAHDLLEGTGPKFSGLVQAQRQAYIRHLEQRRRPADFKWDGSKEIAVMEQHLNAAKDPLERDFWAIHLWRHHMDCGMPVPSSVQNRVTHVSPDSPAWVLAANALKALKKEHAPSSPWPKLIHAIQSRNPNQDLITFLSASPK